MITESLPADRLLDELGITEPDEIDLDLIAYATGARVRQARLAQGDARIFGMGDRAVITVDDRASLVRQRFSIAHELGHWHLHRGQRLICQGGEMADYASSCGKEREADLYAAELLMPSDMLVRVTGGEEMSVELVQLVAEVFRVSTMAAALRLADMHPGQFAMVFQERDGRRWFRRSRNLPDRWMVWLNDGELPPTVDGSPVLVSAVRWFRGTGLKGLTTSVTSLAVGSDTILGLLEGPQDGCRYA